MGGYYILNGHEPVEVSDVLEWARWFESADRRVASTAIGNAFVSTVFLGLDHNHRRMMYGGGDEWGPPILFETMVFGKWNPALDGLQMRYATWDEAVAGHAEIVKVILRHWEG